jgi:toxin ParE1/3/4
MKVRFTLEALADIEAIRLYISGRSPAAAARIIARIFPEADRLGDFPQLGHGGVVTGTLEWTMRGLPFIIVHELDGAQDEVVILDVFHGALDR